MSSAREIERVRLCTIADAWRLIAARRSALGDAVDALGLGSLRVFLPDRERHARAVSAGLCIYCHERLATNGQRCSTCATSANGRRRDEYQRRKAAGICIRPGCGRPSDGTVYCSGCRADNAAKHRRRRAATS